MQIEPHKTLEYSQCTKIEKCLLKYSSYIP